MKIITTQHSVPGRRLWRKVRRRLRTIGLLRLYPAAPLDINDNWSILMSIAHGGMQSFQAEKRLRSAQFQDLHVYALLRSTMLLDDPPRTRVRSVLKRILQFRDKPFPKPGKPVVLPLLGSDRFKQKVQQWMNQQIQDHKEFIIPFHLPSKSVVAGKFPSLRTRLYDHLHNIQQWDWDIQPECLCDTHLQQHPHLQTVDGHVASPASLLNLSRRMRMILQHSADAQVYPSMVQCIQESWHHIFKWSKYIGLNNVTFESWEDFIKAQWSDHVRATWTSIDDRNIRFLKQVMAPFFVHGRDHAITHCHVYCPMFAWTIYKKTFGDPLVYERTSLSVPQAEVYVDLTTQKTFLKKYKWGMDLKNSTLPIVYLLFKQKKQYKSARPIISYLQLVYAKLFTKQLPLSSIY